MHAVASWFGRELAEPVSALRIQSGFYSRDALRPFLPRFASLLAADAELWIVIGSNEGRTLAHHMRELAQAAGLPRQRSRLGVVYLAGAFFHPKTIHFTRPDGSQAAYVGSANFTLPGIAAKHVEAGLLLDTRQGDPAGLLAEVAAAADAWFEDQRPGFEPVADLVDVDRLLAEGVLSAAPAPRPPRPAGPGGQPTARPSQPYLVNLPVAAGEPQAPEPPVEEAFGLSVTQRTPPYPPYMFFVPDSDSPTRGAEALSGTGLGSATGLVIRLSRDADRHWREAPGTANISIPVATASTIRFGIYGNKERPRAEFDLHLRYMDDDSLITALPEGTGLMSFGYTEGDIGHADLRLVIPKPPVAAIRAELVARGLRLPEAGDLAILEWPTASAPLFRMTVTNPASGLGQTLWTVWQDAATTSQLVSRGACWLPADLSPAW